MPKKNIVLKYTIAKIHPCLLLLQSDLFADIETDLDQVACNKFRKKKCLKIKSANIYAGTSTVVHVL